MDKHLEKNAKGGINLLETYKSVFKKPEIEPIIELSLEDKDLVGKVKYYHSEPIEVHTQMPKNFKEFFESLLTIAKARMKEESIKTKLWHLSTQEKYLNAIQNQRYQELSSNETQTLNPLFLAFDEKNIELTEKLIKLTKEKESLLLALDNIKAKLKNKHYKLKFK